MKQQIVMLALLAMVNLLPAFSQKLTIESFELASSDLSASTNERLDLNEKPCALVKVRLTAAGITFDGNIIGSVDYKTGEYWVYMTEGSKNLKVMHNSLLPLELEFSDYNVTALLSRHTYVLTLKVPDGVKLQREADVHGKYRLTIGENENITLIDARIRCVELAKAAAIKAEFGEMVTSDVLSKGGENYENELAKAKGDWLGDTRKPSIGVEYTNDKLTFIAEVWGKAREIVQAKTDLDWKVLRGGEGNEESSKFNHKDRIRIQFKSPVNGYVAIYFIAEDDVTACLLPYPSQVSGQFQVQAGVNYTFFDSNIDPNAKNWTLQIPDSGIEIQKSQLVIIFSPNPFTKCNDTQTGTKRANTISTDYFQKWLLNCQRADADMIVNKKWVTIQKPVN